MNTLCMLVISVFLVYGDAAIPTSNTQKKIRTSEVERILSKHGSVLQKAVKVKDSLTCASDIGLYAESSEEWALRMEDAEGKPGSGIMDGHNQWIGAYDECRRVAASVEYNDTSSNTLRVRKFNGKYCRSYWFNEYGELFSHGSCVPDSCSTDDVTLMYNIDINGNDSIPVFYTFCGVHHDFGKDPSAIAGSVILSIFAVLIICATVYDIAKAYKKKQTPSRTSGTIELQNHSNGVFLDDVTKTNESKLSINGHASSDVIVEPKTIAKSSKYHLHNGNGDNAAGGQSTKSPMWERLLISFSLKTNLPKMISTAQPKGSYDCINGVRSLSMLWIILHHTHNLGLIMNSTVTVKNQYTFGYLGHMFSFQAVMNGQVAVETFFVLSSCLVAISFFKTTERQGGKIKIRQMVLFYVHRYFRLTPVYMLIIMIAACYIRYAPNGPLRPEVINGAAECRESWWTHLIYLNNFLKLDKPCLPHSWYLANDMQFFVLSPIFLIPLALVPVSGYIIVGIMFAGHMTIFIYMHYRATMIEDFDGYNNIYIKPYCRIGPYLIGSMLGYIMFKTKCRVRMHKLVVLVGWLLALFVLFLTIYGNRWISCADCNTTKRAAVVAYKSTLRSTFSLCVAWIVFACSTNNGGFINSFLSWKLFVPLSRLTFTAYLLHPIIQFYYAYTRYDLIYVQLLPFIYLFIGHAVLAVAAAFVISICLEVPFLELDKILLPRT